MIYLDNGATTYPKPIEVTRVVEQSFKTLFANPGRGGYSAAEKSAYAVFEARKKLGKMFSCPPDRGVFTANCTAALNICIDGLLSSGDHVICSSLEHNAVTRPLNYVCQNGVTSDIAEVIFGDMDATYNSFKNLIKPNTKMIITTHASNVTGTVMPISRLGTLCKEKGILLCVDAAQTAGILPINMEEMNIDYLCLAPHKGLYAPMGTGALLCHGKVPRPLIKGGTGTNSVSEFQPDELPERLESGTVNLPGIVGISAGIDFVNKKTTQRIYSHEISLLQTFYKALNNMSAVMLYTDLPKIGECAPVLPFNIAGLSSEQTAGVLAQHNIAVRAGLHCAPSAHRRIGTISIGAVRITPSAFNKTSEINELINVIQLISNKQKSVRSY